MGDATAPEQGSGAGSAPIDVEITVEVDAIGLTCPMPLLKAKRALNGMAPGEHLRVRATDPGSVRDFEVFARQSGHALLGCEQEGDVFVHVLCKRAVEVQTT